MQGERNIYVTEVDKPDPRFLRSKFVVHYMGTTFQMNEFNTRTQLDSWFKLMGITLVHIDTNSSGVTTYRIDQVIQEILFWNLVELPQGVKRHKGVSNGDIVDCYVFVQQGVTTVFRPNPNAKEVYKPLTIDERIAFKNDNKKFLV
ncbi:hypothetical protein [Bacillus toyonensis]|uniref:hypothetical protein n=1 Tax=Bacillus toyonensis TaxID=155322 RepID=UPI000BF9F782|nr:hypothetical protein [Bacillus toyonensis]PGF04968.1 hypothetical protein COM61_00575 [Bacillus toyonensis]